MSKATHTLDSRLRVTRRGFLKASGVSAAVAATATVGAVPFAASALPRAGMGRGARRRRGR